MWSQHDLIVLRFSHSAPQRLTSIHLRPLLSPSSYSLLYYPHPLSASIIQPVCCPCQWTVRYFWLHPNTHRWCHLGAIFYRCRCVDFNEGAYYILNLRFTDGLFTAKQVQLSTPLYRFNVQHLATNFLPCGDTTFIDCLSVRIGECAMCFIFVPSIHVSLYLSVVHHHGVTIVSVR